MRYKKKRNARARSSMQIGNKNTAFIARDVIETICGDNLKGYQCGECETQVS